MDEEEFLLKWNNHQHNLMGVFHELLQDDRFVDVTLVCSGVAVHCHKIVLAASSPMFRQLLNDYPCKHPIIILNDINSEDMKSVINFIYQGEASIGQKKLSSFLKAAHSLDISGLNAPNESRGEKTELPVEPPDNQLSKPAKKRRIISPHVTSTSNYINSVDDRTTSYSPPPSSTYPSNLTDDVNISSESKDKTMDIKIEPAECRLDTCHTLDDTRTSFNYTSTNDASLQSTDSLLDTSIPVESDQVNEAFMENNLFPVYQNLNEGIEGDVQQFTKKYRKSNDRKICPHCQKTFCDSYTLKRHLLTHAPSRKRFECPMCNAAYMRKDHLIAHIKQKHSDSIHPKNVKYFLKHEANVAL